METIENKKGNGWLYLGIVYLLMNYAAIFDMALGGIKHDNKLLLSELLLNAVIFWFIWKRMGWRKAYGAIFGVVTYIALLFFSQIIAAKYNNLY